MPPLQPAKRRARANGSGFVSRCGLGIKGWAIGKLSRTGPEITMNLSSSGNRHKWGPEVRTYGSRESVCSQCGLRRIKRFAHNIHWTEWKKGGVFIESAKTPPCQREGQ